MRSVKYRASGPVASKVRRGAQGSAASQESPPSAREPVEPPPRSIELAKPWDGHGGVVYLPKSDWSGKPVPGHRVVTVGYPFSADEKNSFDFDTIGDALYFLTNDNLRYWDGAPAYTDRYNQHPYEIESREVIVIREGHYDESLTIGVWVELVADGDVVIQAPTAEGAVIYIGKVLPGRWPIPAVRIGSRDSIYLEKHPNREPAGTFRILPFGYPDNLDPNRSQRGIDCADDQKLDIEGTTFVGFRAHGSGAGIRNFLGTASDCHFKNCSVFVGTGPAAKPGAKGKSANGGAISGTDYASQDTVDRITRSRPDLSLCTFENCTAEDNGGAVERINRIIGCMFKECKAKTGGACYDVGTVSHAELEEDPTSGEIPKPKQSEFDRCCAKLDGGAIANARVVMNVKCSGCSAEEGSGGALFEIAKWIGFELKSIVWSEGKEQFLTVAGGCTISACTASQGGAIANCAARIAFSFLDGNKATGRGGGGLYKVKGDINGCSITRNSAVAAGGKKKPRGQMGGGLHSCSGNITNCIVAGNHAGEDGGGLFNCDGALRHLDILGNKADGLGGGARDCRAKIQNCIILGNWSVGSKGDKANSNQLSNCSDPKHCFLPGAWVGDRSTNAGNVFDDGNGPGFVTAGLPAEPNRAGDPTTLDDFAILDTYDARKLRLTDGSRARGRGKDFGVERDFDDHARPNPADGDPDIGAYEYPPQ